jgi:hypothetical protein
LFAIPIDHPSIIIRDGFPKVQAYSFHIVLGPHVIEDRENELRQVSGRARDFRTMSDLPDEDRGCKGVVEINQGGRRTRGITAQVRRS